jgi:hypothetical protein
MWASLLATPLACGGAQAAPKSSDEQPRSEESRSSGIAMSSEIGGLDEQQVNAAFESSLKSLEGCLRRGSERVEFLGGSVSFFLKIGQSGRIDRAYLEKSTLGDRETEKCMLSALRSKDWPKPVGGEHGLARKSFEFDPPNDVRPPADYDNEHLREGLSKVTGELGACSDGKGGFEATIYVGTDGNVLAAGVAPPDEEAEDAVDCLVKVLKAASFPSPGSWPAKVTFAL